MCEFEREQVIDVPKGRDESPQRTMILCALWRLLNNPGSRLFLIGETDEQGRNVMQFVKDLITSDAVLTALARWQGPAGWRSVQMGQDDAYAAHYLTSNNPEALRRGNATAPTTYILLNAGTSDRGTNALSRFAEGRTNVAGVKLVRIW